MKLAVLGASRGLGRELARMAADAGHEVTTMARRPIDDPRMRSVAGDVRDPGAVAAATAGQDAVCFCVGVPVTRKPVDVFSRGTQAVLDALTPGQKLVVVTGIGAGDSRGHGGWLYDRVLLPLLVPTIYADKTVSEALVKASAADWLIVRPGFLHNGPRTGRYRVVDDLTGVTAGRISRKDVADFILAQLARPTHFGWTPLLTD